MNVNVTPGALPFVNKFALLYTSCDKYSDVWKPYFKLFFRFWPDCPFKIYLLSNNLVFKNDRIQSICVGNDISWSDCMFKALEGIKEEYILLLLDDFFLSDNIDTKEILSLFEWIRTAKPNYVRLNPTVKPDKPFNSLVGIVSKDTIYRTSTIVSLWKKETLTQLLIRGESAWDFEIFGTERSDRYDAFYSTWKDYIPVFNGIIKGKWERGAIKKLASLGIEIDYQGRQVMSHLESIWYNVKCQRSMLLNLLPSQHRKKIKHILSGGKYNYNIKR